MFPELPHAGEPLYVGQYAEAEKCFRHAIGLEEDTKWSWIGLGAARMFQGEEEEAIEIWKKGIEIVKFEGPTLYAYRGECLRLLGRNDEARKDLEHAHAKKPTRITAKINLALIDAKENPEATRAYVDTLWRDYPVMMYDIAKTPNRDAEESLQKILLAMKGNRSSTFIMYLINGNPRFM